MCEQEKGLPTITCGECGKIIMFRVPGMPSIVDEACFDCMPSLHRKRQQRDAEEYLRAHPAGNPWPSEYVPEFLPPKDEP